MNHLPSQILIERAFWRKHRLHLDLYRNWGSVMKDGKRYKGGKGCSNSVRHYEAVTTVIEDHEVDNIIERELNFPDFSNDCSMQDELRDLICKHRQIFIAFACVKNQVQKIKPISETQAICLPSIRRSPNEGELEKKCMTRLLKLEVLEHLVSP